MASQPIYQFYAQLNDYEPKIWRRFQVPKNISVAKLGYIIMTMFEMYASHLFYIENKSGENHFRSIKKRFPNANINDYEDFIDLTEVIRYEVKNEFTIEYDDEKSVDAAQARMSNVLRNTGDKSTLMYDFGDGWGINIVLEDIIIDKELPGKELPRVLEGEGLGIIEDCGGTYGLYEIAKAFKKKKSEMYNQYSEWLGVKEIDLITFDIDDMNFRLKKVPRIYADCYEYDLMPTKQSMKLLNREYKKN